MLTIFVLLVAFQAAHFLADYPMQTPYMLKKFAPGKEFILPLLAHVITHGAFTALIVAALTGDAQLTVGLACFDMAVHFVMDRFKAGPKWLGRYKALAPSEFAAATPTQKKHNKFFWWSLGFDQMVHHLTHYVIIYILVM